MSSQSEESSHDPSEMSETESTKQSEVSTCGTDESSSSHESEGDNESNDPLHPDDQPGFGGGEQSVLDLAPTVEAPSSSWPSIVSTKKRKRSSPHEGRRPAPAPPALSIRPPTRDEEPRIKREATPALPLTEIAPYAERPIDDEESEPSQSDTGEAASERGRVDGMTAKARTALPRSKAPSTLPPALMRPLRALAKRGSKWSADEDAMLRQTKREEGLTWDQVSVQLPGRSTIACRRRWGLIADFRPAAPHSSYNNSGDGGKKSSAPIHRRASKGLQDPTPPPLPSVKLGSRWTSAEIDELNHLKASDVQWPEICRQLRGRTAAGCRGKWENLRKEAKPLSSSSSSSLMLSSSRGAAAGRQKSRTTTVEKGEVESDSDEGDGAIYGGGAIYSGDNDDIEAASVFDDSPSDSTSSDVDSSESANEDEDEDGNDTEAEKRRKHALFFLNR